MKHLKKPLTVAGAVVGLSLTALSWSSLGEMPCTFLASDLIGLDVESKDGENLGEIHDVVVHPGNDQSYAVLSYGGWLGMGDKLFAMPWSVLHAIEHEGTDKKHGHKLVLPVDKERLKAAPGFDKKSWPAMANADWTKDIDTYYAGDLNPNTKRPVSAGARTSYMTWKASELKGANVETPTGEKLGDIKDVAIDVNGRVSYVALSVGGFLGMGDTVVAVPWDAMKFTVAGDKGDKKKITLATTKEQLEKAPRFDTSKADLDMCNPQFIGSVYEYFKVTPYDTSASAPVKKTPTHPEKTGG
jgi:sporulation protein YlmC with PRC-barrel domain